MLGQIGLDDVRYPKEFTLLVKDKQIGNIYCGLNEAFSIRNIACYQLIAREIKRKALRDPHFFPELGPITLVFSTTTFLSIVLILTKVGRKEEYL